MSNIRIIGIAGGSGSGKTYLAKKLLERIGPEHAGVISQDSYYIDQSHRFDGDGGSVNFDHPDSIDSELLANHLNALKAGETIQIPIYDFATHSRQTESIQFTPKPIVLIDGILIFHWEKVRAEFDDLVFLDIDEELRFSRRLERDVRERGRTPEGVKAQFYNHVKPMHDQFVEPSIAHANYLIHNNEEFDQVLEKLAGQLLELV